MAAPGGVGFFGKLPGVGDFVQRRLPPAFVAEWDRSFEAAVNGARAEFGEAWDAVWRSGPVWRFALGPGVCGGSAWVGVTGPSVDRVGRRFPMVLAHELESADEAAAIVRGAADWYATLEQVCATACSGSSISGDAFDAAVLALSDPVACANAAARAVPSIDVGGGPTPWRQGGEDRQLEAAWFECGAVHGGCLWWTRGHAAMAPSVCATQGLPRASVYARFLAASADAVPPPASFQPAAPLRADDDVFGDLLTGFAGTPDPVASAPASAEPVDALLRFDAAPQVRAAEADADATVPGFRSAQDAAPAPSGSAAKPAVPVDSGVGGGTVVVAGVDAEPASPRGPILLQEGAATLIAADNGEADPRRQATARVDDACTDGAWLDATVARSRLLALHPDLLARHEDLLDPVPEDGAVAATWLREGYAVVLRIGAALAWHSRHGQLRPLFGDAVPEPLPGELDTVRPNELVGVAPGGGSSQPGLGAAAEPLCEQATCEVEAGDRLILLATDTLLRVPAASLAASLAGASVEESRSRIAASAGLDMDRAQWPVAVIEVGT